MTPRKDTMNSSESAVGSQRKHIATVVVAGILASALLLAAGISGCGRKEAPKPQGAKVLIFGVDGADWLILDAMRERGELPNFDRLILEGSHGLLRSLEPILSPLIWTSMATGKTPDKHGILDFVVKDPSTGNQVPISSRMRRVEAVWNMAGAFDRKVAFIGWLATWPAEPVKGIMVTDRLSYQSALLQEESRHGLCSPPSYIAVAESVAALAEQVAPEAIRAFIDVTPEELEDARAASFDPSNPINNFRLIYITSETYRRLAVDILTKERPDLMAVYFEEVDSVGHLFMPYSPPRMPGVTEEEMLRFGGAVQASYRHMDRALGELMAAAGDEYCIIVVSDHGFKSGDSRPRHDPSPREHAAEWHRLHGVMIMWGPHIKRGFRLEGASVLDVTPTVLALMGLPVARDMDGRPLTEAFNEVFLSGHPVDEIESYEPLLAEARGRRQAGPAESPVDEEMLEKLRALGYLGPATQESEVPDDDLGQPDAGEEGRRRGVGEASSGLEPEAGDQERLASWHSNRGVALLREGRYREAEAEFREAASKNPSSPTVHNNLGLAAMELGRAKDAEASFRRALQLDPNYVNAHINLAVLYDRARRDSLAITEYRKAMELEPSKASIHSSMGNFYATRGHFRQALPFMQKAVELEPYSAKLLRDLGAVSWSLGDMKGAAEHFGKAVALEPSSVQSRLLLAKALVALGEMDEARSHLQRCLELDPGNAEARELLGQ